jgi:hypothetical protein
MAAGSGEQIFDGDLITVNSEREPIVAVSGYQ